MTDNSRLISVIIPCYNCKDYIVETVNSVLAQTYKNFEIIVVDDGSKDGLFEAHGDYFRANGVIYIRKENGGPASARNLGFEKSKGDLVAFLDSDDIWAPDKLEKQAAAINAGDCGLVYARRAEFISEKGAGAATVSDNTSYSGDAFDELIVGNFITNSSVMVGRSVLNSVGGFREEKFFFAIEDYQLWLRIAAKYRLCFVDQPLIFYRLHQNQISKSSLKTLQKLSKMYFDFFKSGELGRRRGKTLFLAVKYYLNYIKCACSEKLSKNKL